MNKKNLLLSTNIVRRSFGLVCILFALAICLPSSAKGAQTMLTADELARIIAKSASMSDEPISFVTQILGDLGEQVTVTGDVLREALSDSHIGLSEPLSVLVSSLQTVSKTGDTIVLKNDREMRASIKGIAIKFKTTITVNLAIEANQFTISKINGVAVQKVLWFDVQRVQLGFNPQHSSLCVVTSGGSRQFSFPRT